MPNCRVCVQPLADGSRFCGHCGASVDASMSPTRTSLPSAKKLNKILVLIIALLIVALVTVSFLKTGVIPTPWTQKPQTSSTATPTSIVQANLSLPYPLKCSCDAPIIAITITKVSVAPEAGVQVWSLSFQARTSVYGSLLFFSLQNSSNPDNTTQEAIGDSIAGYSGCPISLDPGQKTSRVVVFFFVPLAHAQYTLTTAFNPCGGTHFDFDQVPFTFS